MWNVGAIDEIGQFNYREEGKALEGRGLQGRLWGGGHKLALKGSLSCHSN